MPNTLVLVWGDSGLSARIEGLNLFRGNYGDGNGEMAQEFCREIPGMLRFFFHSFNHSLWANLWLAKSQIEVILLPAIN